MNAIYLSGKIRNCRNYKSLFKKAEILCKELGYDEVINPIDLDHLDSHMAKMTWEDYLIRDLRIILFQKPDMYMIKNWQESPGAKLELAVAKELKLNIIYQ